MSNVSGKRVYDSVFCAISQQDSSTRLFLSIDVVVTFHRLRPRYVAVIAPIGQHYPCLHQGLRGVPVGCRLSVDFFPHYR